MPGWAVVSSAAAPVFLIGGWRLAAARQLGGFDPVSQTISALAGHGANDRWIMTAALAGVGVCHTLTATGLRSAAVAGRALLATGGVATIVLAAFPQPVRGSSTVHVGAASVALTTLSLWPALAVWRHPGAPVRRGFYAAAAVLLGLLGWFGAQYLRSGPRVGQAERVVTGAQALWPLVAVLLARRR